MRAFCLGPGHCAFDADPATHRVSFVLEQYRLPPEKLARTPTFVVAPSKREQNLLPVVYAMRGVGPWVAELWLWGRRRRVSPRHAAVVSSGE